MLAFGLIIFTGLVVTALTPGVVFMASGRLLWDLGPKLWLWPHTWRSRDGSLKSELGLAFAFAASASSTWIFHRTNVTNMDCGCLRILAMAVVGFGWIWRFCIIGTTLYWSIDSRGEKSSMLGRDGIQGKSLCSGTSFVSTGRTG